ncbi:MAG: AAA family ATPase [Bacteroidales bacterium]|nr:AAA family ATPase [Bacteroidales bacterium]
MSKIPDYKYGKPFKFRAMNVFASAEWMADSKRKYRTVFDKNEINYLRFEFSFFNKLFDEQDWEAMLSVEVIDKNVKNEDDKEKCKLAKSIKITKDQNVVFYNRSWGVDEYGGYWEQGEYTVNGYVDDELLGSVDVVIHDVGQVTQTYNPFFDVVDLKLFEGPFDLPDDKKYLKIFPLNKTRYVWAEFSLKTKVPKGTKIEYFVNFLDDAGQLKASVREFFELKVAKRQIATYNTGWGNNDGGSWYDNKYFVNVVFMDTLVASTFFEMGEEPVEGINKLIEGAFKTSIQQQVEEVEDKKQSIEDVMTELNALIGLQSIKKQITDHIKYIDFLKLRKEKGFEEADKITLHSVFTGNPGTGKTTVVRYLGKIYQHMGLLTEGHVHEVDRTDLVGEFIGQTAPKVKKAIDKARGGILFIDEAYSLFRTKEEEKDFGREVIEIIIKEMSDGPGNLAIMVAGYPKEMETFLNSNPGMKSRFKYYFNFPDYTPDELTEIAQFGAYKRSVTIHEEAQIIIRKILVEAYRNRDKSFGNARFAHSLIGQAKMNMGLRIIELPDYKKLSKEQISTITKADVEPMLSVGSASKIEIDVDEQLLKEAMEDLDKLIGLENVKEEVTELIKLVRYYREIGKDVINSFSMHAVFTGNPGTGKTTIARILGKLYKSLGLIEKGHVVETGREGLIAGYVGQTAIKTKEMIDQAMGGVLFIDEAYGLTDDKQNSFGGEAIEVILKNMEDNRGKFAVIAAGYPENMDRFMKANPGLMSRFDEVIHFKDYSGKELIEIAEFMLLERELVFDLKAKEYLCAYLEKLLTIKDKYFGNAREVRKIIEDVVRRQNLRMADTQKHLRTYDNIRTVTIEDVKHLVFEKPRGKSFGFSS